MAANPDGKDAMWLLRQIHYPSTYHNDKDLYYRSKAAGAVGILADSGSTLYECFMDIHPCYCGGEVDTE